MILRSFLSLRVFTVYMGNLLLFEISLWSNKPKWNLHRSEFHFTWTHVNVNNEVTLHQSEILPRSEISNRFEFTSGLMQMCSHRSSGLEVFYKKHVLKNFEKFTGKHLWQNLSLNKIAGLTCFPVNSKEILWHRCFPVNFAKFIRTPFFIENLWWLLLFLNNSNEIID